MLREPRLMPFYSTHKYDLKLNFDDGTQNEDDEDERPWPDTAQLFGEDAEYQGLIMELMGHVDDSIDMVLDYIQVSASQFSM